MHLEGKNWMATLAENAGTPIVKCTKDIEPLVLQEEGEEVLDPHAWFTCENAARYVGNIAAALSEIDPEHAADYAARAELYLQQLRVLDGWLRRVFNTIPPARRLLITGHDAFNYFAAEYGFEHRAPVGWSTGSEVGAGMTPERRRRVIASLRDSGVQAVFFETSMNPKLIREIAREAGVSIGGALYSDSMGEPGAPGETYFGMMRENALTILRALR